ncbi:MAG TPA: hypothetical protein VEI07_26020, partial [Planctomycetaceae bacterium]|nr:hypothetical protein [Planctomycetaceae bacterium]
MARVLRPGGYLIYVDLTFPHWLSRAGRLLGPLMSFPSIKGFESFAAREACRRSTNAATASTCRPFIA